MNEQRAGLSLRHTEYIRGYLWHIYSGTGITKSWCWHKNFRSDAIQM